MSKAPPPPEDVNSLPYWIRKHRDQGREGWYGKRKYRLLSHLLPGWCLLHKSRKDYLRTVASLAEGTFLDMGCGLGICAAIYALRTGRTSVGADFSRAGVTVAREEARRHGIRARYLVTDALRSGFRDRSFDTVYLGQILEHLADDAPPVREALRILRPGGKLIVSVPREEEIPSAEHFRIYTEESVRRFLEDLGLSGVEFHGADRRRIIASARAPR